MAGGTIGQPYVFAAALWAGMAAGALYSLLTVFRHGMRCGKAADALIDILFIALALALTCGALYLSCRLSLRIYHFLGIFCGFAAFELAVVPCCSLLFRKFYIKSVDKRDKKGCNKLHEKRTRGRRTK